MGKIKLKLKSEENVPLIRSNSSSVQDLVPTTSNNDYQQNKWVNLFFIIILNLNLIISEIFYIIFHLLQFYLHE